MCLCLLTLGMPVTTSYITPHLVRASCEGEVGGVMVRDVNNGQEEVRTDGEVVVTVKGDSEG